MERPRTKTEAKRAAQDAILNYLAGLGTQLDASHWYDEWTDEQREQFNNILQHQIDRVAKTFGYDRQPFVPY